MAFSLVPLALGLLQLAAAGPALTLQDLEVADDTMSVGSYIREVRAAAPDDYHKSYENEGDGEIGYSRKKSGGGKKGYQHFDSYHKKAGDHYEFEKADSFGLDKDENSGAHGHEQDGAHSNPNEQRVSHRRPHKRQQKRQKKDEEYYQEPQYEKYEEEKPKNEELKETEEISKEEPNHEELREDSDGNHGVEASGHDPKDYILPEKYTWGEEEIN